MEILDRIFGSIESMYKKYVVIEFPSSEIKSRSLTACVIQIISPNANSMER
jgi:hypothetical protein